MYSTTRDKAPIYEKCKESLKNIIEEIETTIKANAEFRNVGSKMVDLFKLSLDEQTHKELPDEIVRTWNEN